MNEKSDLEKIREANILRNEAHIRSLQFPQHLPKEVKRKSRSKPVALKVAPPSTHVLIEEGPRYSKTRVCTDSMTSVGPCNDVETHLNKPLRRSTRSKTHGINPPGIYHDSAASYPAETFAEMEAKTARAKGVTFDPTISNEPLSDFGYSHDEGDDDMNDEYVEPEWYNCPNPLDTNEDLKLFVKMHQNMKNRLFADDRDTPVNPDYPQAGSKKLFAERIAHIQAANSISNKALTELLVEIARIAPNLESVVRQVGGELAGVQGSAIFKLELALYVEQMHRKYIVHVCEAGCCGYFAGDDALRCHECCRPRLTKCASNGCQNEDCNPFRGGHCMNSRTAIRCMSYRPLIPLLEELVEWSAKFDNNVYNYATEYIAERAKLPKLKDGRVIATIEDVWDGPQAMENMSEMNQYYKSQLLKHPGLVEKSFLLSVSYDGGAMFSREDLGSVWPVVIQILNSSPSDRTEPGIGLFMVGLHDLSVGMTSEEELFSQLLIPELKLLGRGHIVSSVDKDGNKIDILLQARVLFHVLDTKAFEKVANVQGK